MYGFNGKILRVNLSTRVCSVEEPRRIATGATEAAGESSAIRS